jgi:hypothetical protein
MIVLGDPDAKGQTHLSITGEINLQRLAIILKAKGCHGEENIFTVDRLALLLLALLGCCCTISRIRDTADAVLQKAQYVPSLVMKEMNSLTHSCMHSLASFAILAFSGNAIFMIRATGAKLCMLASLSQLPFGLFFTRCDVWDGDDCGEGEGIAIRPVDRASRRLQGAGWRMSL